MLQVYKSFTCGGLYKRLSGDPGTELHQCLYQHQKALGIIEHQCLYQHQHSWSNSLPLSVVAVHNIFSRMKSVLYIR